jgi:hypothetical protein
MSPRRARLVFEPLTDWPYPQVRHERSPFTARWIQTRDLLLREADALGATLIVVELDMQRGDLRQDGEIRANARLGSGKVRLSLDSRLGPMRYACDRYHAGAASWQANARAIALTLEALRTVERYGAVHSAEQYQGFMALPAAASGGFASADEAQRWLYEQAECGADASVGTAWKYAARRHHPDRGGDPMVWARLDEARQLLEKAGLL